MIQPVPTKAVLQTVALSITDTIWTKLIALISEVFLFQGENNTLFGVVSLLHVISWRNLFEDRFCVNKKGGLAARGGVRAYS